MSLHPAFPDSLQLSQNKAEKKEVGLDLRYYTTPRHLEGLITFVLWPEHKDGHKVVPHFYMKKLKKALRDECQVQDGFCSIDFIVFIA